MGGIGGVRDRTQNSSFTGTPLREIEYLAAHDCLQLAARHFRAARIVKITFKGFLTPGRMRPRSPIEQLAAVPGAITEDRMRCALVHIACHQALGMLEKE